MTMPTAFDPLIDLDGMWTTGSADRYLPLPELPSAKYECLDGRLVMTFNPDRWIQPDVTVLHTLPQTDDELMVRASRWPASGSTWPSRSR